MFEVSIIMLEKKCSIRYTFPLITRKINRYDLTDIVIKKNYFKVWDSLKT